MFAADITLAGGLLNLFSKLPDLKGYGPHIIFNNAMIVFRTGRTIAGRLGEGSLVGHGAFELTA